MAVPTVSYGPRKLTGSLFVLVGSVLLLLAVFSGYKRLEFIQTAEVVEAKVVSLNSGGSHPQIEFKDGRGETVSYPQGGLIYGYEVGDAVRVLYRPENPAATALLDAPGSLWGGVFSGLVVGLIFSAVGIARLFRVKRT